MPGDGSCKVNGEADMKMPLLTRISLLACVFLSSAFAGDRYLVRLADKPLANIWTVVFKYGATLAKTVTGAGSYSLYILEVPAGKLAALKQDQDVASVELDEAVKLPLKNQGEAPNKLSFAGAAQRVNLFGTPAWRPYVQQPAAGIIRVEEARRWATGSGIVALIDTGVDRTHPVLAPALLPGWDFTSDKSGGDENLDQEVTPILDSYDYQEVTPILDGGAVVLNEEGFYDDQEVTPILDSRLPAALGHGTMTAGIIHLVAPTARILPLRAFRSDGTGSLADVIEAIYWAVDHRADVISMSFDSQSSSEELKRAIQYAVSKGIILVASAGNNGKNVTVYPAGYEAVIGVASTSDSDVRSKFSNFGGAVALAAPGEAVISTFPGNRYAMGWGTSFSAPMVSGAAALLLQLDRKLTPATALGALSNAVTIKSPGMGAGRLDLVQACIAIGR
jgi:subtilisin family serine protease